jgi:hypothetical protein
VDDRDLSEDFEDLAHSWPTEAFLDELSDRRRPTRAWNALAVVGVASTTFLGGLWLKHECQAPPTAPPVHLTALESAASRRDPAPSVLWGLAVAREAEGDCDGAMRIFETFIDQTGPAHESCPEKAHPADAQLAVARSQITAHTGSRR